MSGAAQGQPGRWGSDRESIDILRKSFRLFDKNGDGDISAVELKSVLCNLGEKPTEEMVGAMIDLADIDGNGTLDMHEFRRCIGSSDLGLSPGEVNGLMDEADADGDGLVSYEEFVSVAYDALAVLSREKAIMNALNTADGY